MPQEKRMGGVTSKTAEAAEEGTQGGRRQQTQVGGPIVGSLFNLNDALGQGNQQVQSGGCLEKTNVILDQTANPGHAHLTEKTPSVKAVQEKSMKRQLQQIQSGGGITGSKIFFGPSKDVSYMKLKIVERLNFF